MAEMRRAAIVLVLLLAMQAAAAAAGELALVLGYRTGDVSFLVEADATGIACLLPPCVVAEASTPESEALGLILDLPIAQGWMFEARLDRQDADLSLSTTLPPEAGPVGAEGFELTSFQVGVLRQWAGDGLRPFATAGVGLASAKTSAAVLEPPIGPGEAGRRLGSRDGLAISLGGGAKKALGSRWGLRLEARVLWIDLPSEVGGKLTQLGLEVGLSTRLGD